MDTRTDLFDRMADEITIPPMPTTTSRPIRPAPQTVNTRVSTRCIHANTRSLYIRTRAGAKTTRLVKVGKLCDCGQATIDQG